MTNKNVGETEGVYSLFRWKFVLYANSVTITTKEKHGYDNGFQIKVLTTEWFILLMRALVFLI